MEKYYVYIHTTPDGKKYVGCTRNIPEIRWKKGKYYNSLFYKAVQKYNWGNITHEVLEVNSEEEMYRKEIELISFYHSNDPKYGYNISSGGPGVSLPEWYRKQKPKLKYYEVRLPNGRIKIMSKTEAYVYFRKYYDKHPWKERKGPKFLREVN